MTNLNCEKLQMADEKNKDAKEHSHKMCNNFSPHSVWVTFSTMYINFISRCFALLGTAIAQRPRGTILICCSFVALCAIGFVWMKTENRAEKLFIPQDSRAIKDMNKAENNFPMESRIQQVIFTPKKSYQNTLAKECLQDVLTVHHEVVSTGKYTDLCLSRRFKPGPPPYCLFLNPLEILQFNETNFDNATSKFEAAYRNRAVRMRNGRPFWYNMGAMFGGLEIEKASGKIQNVEAIRVMYFMKSDQEDKSVIDWEKDFLDGVRTLKNKLTCMNVLVSAQRSLDDAINESTVTDIGFISVTYTLMISFACITLGKFRNPLTGHSLLANIGIFSVFLGILAGFGFAMLVQTPFVSIVGALPFLIVGIGIDDMFILIDELDRIGPQFSVVDTIKLVMANAGPTITMTTMTDLVAFAVSTWSELPSIQYFCLYAAMAIFFAYLMIISFFVAMMTFDVRRVKAGRRDCFPFCHAPPPKEGAPAWDEPSTQASGKLLEMWGKILMRVEVKIIVVVVSLGLCGVGVYGALNISEDFEPKLLAKDGSPFLRFSEAQEKYFPQQIEVSIILDEQVNYTSLKTQKEILRLSEIASQNSFYENTTLSWMDSLHKFSKKLHLSTEGKSFMPTLTHFLRTPVFTHFMEDLRFSEDGKILEASRILCYMKSSFNSIGQRDAMVTLREDVDDSPLPAYPIAKPFVYFEQYAITFKATVRNLAIASAAILVITSPFLVNLSVTFLVFFGFAALIFELFGLMYFWGVSLHGVSMINLVMAIGFAVDYSAHVAHAYVMSSKNTAEERVVEALRTLGASVLMGGASTFIGMVMLAFASSEIFRIFFKMFFGIVFLGLLHGLCFLPVYLSIFCRSSAINGNGMTKREAPDRGSLDGNDSIKPAVINRDSGIVIRNDLVIEGCNGFIGASGSTTPLICENTDADRETRL